MLWYLLCWLLQFVLMIHLALEMVVIYVNPMNGSLLLSVLSQKFTLMYWTNNSQYKVCFYAVLADPWVPVWNLVSWLLIHFAGLVSRCLVCCGFGPSSILWNFMFRSTIASIRKLFCFGLVFLCLFLFSSSGSAFCLYDFFKHFMDHLDSKLFCGVLLFLFSVWACFKAVEFAFGMEKLDAPLMNSVIYRFILCVLWHIVLVNLLFLWDFIMEALHLILEGTCFQYLNILQVTEHGFVGNLFYMYFLCYGESKVHYDCGKTRNSQRLIWNVQVRSSCCCLSIYMLKEYGNKQWPLYDLNWNILCSAEDYIDIRRSFGDTYYLGNFSYGCLLNL